MSRPDFVYFDIDDTLLDHTLAERLALDDVIAERADVFDGRTHDEIVAAYRDVNSRVWSEYAAGSRSKEQTKYGRFELLLNALDRGGSGLHVELADLYLDRYSNHWTFMEGAEAAWQTVSSTIPCGLLTNGFSEIQRAKLSRFPVLDRNARHVVISDEIGWLKPHRALFDHAAEVAGVRPENILFVGDSARSDVEGGLGADWSVAWYRGAGHASERVFCFQDYRELLEYLES
jgi:HAD superfamily hydrolase (TIGR01549 family)